MSFDLVGVYCMMASSSSPSGGPCTYDVFLSFRGEDTRKIFAGHLYRALQQKAIHTFIDSEELEIGNKVSELLTCIEESRLSIVVLSQNYASSTWCLKELVQILDCMDTKKQMVLPIFYEVDPSDLRKIQGKYAEAFAEHGLKPDLDKEELESWRSAVIRVADLIGWDSRDFKDDGKLIEEIVANTHRNLIHTSSTKANGLVGMDSHIAEMMSRLCLQVNDVRLVGIWGMGGLGKTTIARAVYDEIACQFEHSCFLNNVKEAFINKHEVQMQEELLSRLLKEKVQSVDLNRGRNMIMKRLGMKKVLVVLDDVETFDQIEHLLGELHAFGEGSRIIVTTRDKQSLGGVNETYEPMYLSEDEALELFMKYAFRTNQANRDYDHLSRRAIDYAKGLPLALKVLGSFLDNKSICEWEAVLQKLKKIPHIKIQDVLATSYDGLDNSEKDIFLDIACLFRKWNEDSVRELLDSCGFFPGSGLRVLVNRALITVNYGLIDMHDLLQDMGREIVRQESTKESGERSRLWSYGDIYGVLTQNTATDAVECLMLDLSNSKDDLSIDTGAFVRMTKLRLLIIYYSFYSIFDDEEYLPECEEICPVDGCKQLSRGDLESLSHELRFLLWHGCPLKSLPSTFVPKNLVHLDMRGSHIQKLWEEKKPLRNLKVIMLSHCQYLVKIPDFTEAINLQKLFLDGCSSLFEVHSSVFALQNLHFLDLRGCKQLKILPSCIHMKSLRHLYLSGCSNLEKFPEIEDVMTELKELYLDGTGIKELPSSINNLTGLIELNLKGCTELKSLSTRIHMSSLWTLNLHGCSNLEKFPEISGIMKKLPELRLDGTAIKGLPSSIDLLLGIKKLSMRNCKSLVFLPYSICNLPALTHLDLTGCTELKTLSTCIHMSSLQSLNLDGCSSLEKFPEISGIMKELLELCLDGTAIKGLPSSIDLLLGIKKLSMRNFKSLVSLPDSIYNLASLTHLDLQGCTGLKTLSTYFHMSSLQILNLNGCSNLEKFPEISGIMKELSELLLDETAIKGLPSSIDLLPGIKKLSMRNCKSLESLPDSICNLALTHLDLTGCVELKTLSTSIHMSSTQILKPDGCSNLDKFPEISGFMKEQPELRLDETAIKGLPSLIDLLLGIKKMRRPYSAWPSSMEEYCSNFVLLHLDLSDCNLLELSDGIAQLYSLKTLKLCRNNLESLPVTMNRLYCLMHLELEACKRLKSIPELSSSINYIDAHDCTALETVSKPKPPHRANHFFTFSNCLQLVQTNLFRDIVETYLDFQDEYLRPRRLKMCLPGSEVPDWFTHRSRGFSVSVQLPANWLDCRFLGFAICAVLKYQEVHDYTSPLSATCLCTFKGRSGECSFSFDLLGSVFRIDRILQSDHMFQGYVSWSECHLIPEGKLVNETYTEATFQIVVESEFITEQHRITSCGVRFVYADQDEMPNICIAPPQVHVDSCGTGVSSMDTCEMRNEETERVEITEISMEVESLESGEGIDTSHTLQLLLEQPKERKGEKDTMEMTKHEEGCSGGVSGSLCCCLSLDGCIMSMERVAQVATSSEILEGDASGELGILKLTL